jgi:SnoaL-like protein
MNDTNLSTRIDALESRIAIEALIYKYGHAFDGHDPEMLRSIWHDDATLSLGDFGDNEGIDAIMASADGNWKAMPHMHHWMANPLIAIDGDLATGLVAVDVLVTSIESGPTQISGLYRDTYERRNGRWAIATRSLEMHFYTPLANWTPVAGSEAKQAG